MRAAFVRATMIAVGVVIAILVAPNALARLLLITLPEDRFTALTDPIRGSRGAVLVVALALVQIIVAVTVSRFIAARQAVRLTEPMTRLADQAHRFGTGESRVDRVESGIAEIDVVSDALVRGGARISRQLARQRDFAADASHQLRTPLTALLMRLDEIAATDDLSVAREEAGVAIAQVERLTKVVDDLLARSRAQEVDDTGVSLDSVIAALQREWQPAFADARRSVRVHGERGLRVNASPAAVSQIISTLFENSLQHGRGTVDVRARRSGPSVILEVGDQGEGIPLSFAPRIFERAVSSSGSGLGLALARDLAAAHGGRLELVSAQPPVFALFLSEARAAG